MDKNVRFYICNKCKNQVGIIKDNGPKIMCCGEIMDLMHAKEDKNNLFKCNIKDNKLLVDIPKNVFQQEDNEDIMWVALVSDNHTTRQSLKTNVNKELEFKYIPKSSIYVYSNKYGLLKKEIK